MNHGQNEDDAPGDTVVHHGLEAEQRSAVDPDEAHDADKEHTYAGIADAFEKSDDEQIFGEKGGNEQQGNQCEEKGEDEFLYAGERETLILVELVGIEIREFADVRTEDIFADEQEEQGAERAYDQCHEHVFCIIDMGAGHGFIGPHHGKRGLLEGNEGHADLCGIDDAEDHHGRVAFAFFIAAYIAYAVQDAPAYDGRGGGAGQTAEKHDGHQKRVGEQPGSAGHGLAGDEPQRNEFRQPVVVDGGAEHEDEEHHDDDGIAEASAEQGDGLHAADEHECQQSGDARPQDVDEYPSVEYAEKNADEIHAERRKRLKRGELADAEHEGKADESMDEIQDIRLVGRCRGGVVVSHEFLLMKKESYGSLFLIDGRAAGMDRAGLLFLCAVFPKFHAPP